MTRPPTGVSIVVPTVGRPSLATLVRSLGDLAAAPVPVELLTVDGRGRGPAAARNAGWRAARHEWVAFLDDDVVAGPDWLARLIEDLTVEDAVGGVQGRITVPVPADRRPTDWERVTAGLADGAWITADMAYRRTALAQTGGFDERFPRAFREDAELAFRVRSTGWQLLRGRRTIVHPIRPERPWVSIRTQRGNGDDALLRRAYGAHWRTLLAVPPGRRTKHAAVTAAGATALGLAGLAALTGRRSVRAAALAAGAAWAAGTAQFAAERILPGPRTAREVATMVATSIAIPPVAVAAWCRGWLRWRGARPLPVAVPATADPSGAAGPRPSEEDVSWETAGADVSWTAAGADASSEAAGADVSQPVIGAGRRGVTA